MKGGCSPFLSNEDVLNFFSRVFSLQSLCTEMQSLWQAIMGLLTQEMISLRSLSIGYDPGEWFLFFSRHTSRISFSSKNFFFECCF